MSIRFKLIHVRLGKIALTKFGLPENGQFSAMDCNDKLKRHKNSFGHFVVPTNCYSSALIHQANYFPM